MDYILSIDQATKDIGYGVLNKHTKEVIEYGDWNNDKIGDTSELGHTEKRANTKLHIKNLIEKYSDQLIIVVCEGVYYDNNAENHKKLSKVQGSIQDLCYELEMPCHVYNANKWHSYLDITGKRDIIKQKTKDYILEKYPQVEDNLKQDVYDAIAIGLAWIVMMEKKK